MTGNQAWTISQCATASAAPVVQAVGALAGATGGDRALVHGGGLRHAPSLEEPLLKTRARSPGENVAFIF